MEYGGNRCFSSVLSSRAYYRIPWNLGSFDLLRFPKFSVLAFGAQEGVWCCMGMWAGICDSKLRKNTPEPHAYHRINAYHKIIVLQGAIVLQGVLSARNGNLSLFCFERQRNFPYLAQFTVGFQSFSPMTTSPRAVDEENTTAYFVKKYYLRNHGLTGS